jgi:hypothetical protein
VATLYEHYQLRALSFMNDLLMDLRYALRVLWKSPGFTLVASLTLMLSIGANVVVFGLVNAVLLHPLDVSDPQNLYQLRLKPWTNFKLLTTSYPAFEDYRQRNTTFSGMAGFYGYSTAKLRSGNAAMSVSGYVVTGNYFDLLGVQPQVGRFFQAADEHGPNSVPYMVLSNNLWRRAFNADPGVVGAIVQLNEHPFTVVGVAPARFHGTEQFVWPDYLDTNGEPGAGGRLELQAERDCDDGYGAWPVEARCDASAGYRESERDCGRAGKGVSPDRYRMQLRG